MQRFWAQIVSAAKRRDLSTNCGIIRVHNILLGSPQLIAFVMEISLYGGALPVQHM